MRSRADAPSEATDDDTDEEALRKAEPLLVVREGTYGNDFYIIEEGEVRVTKPSRGPVEVCRRLGPSDFFGERALLSTEKRAATVTAVKPTQRLVLDRESFLRLLGPLEGILRREMQGYIEAASSSDDDFR